MKAKVKLYLIIQPSPHGHHGYSKAFISMPLSCSKHGSKGVSDFLSCSYLFRLVPKLINYQGYPITYYTLHNHCYQYAGNAFECYSTLGTNKKWNDPGNPTECKLEAGYSIRKCVKFKTGKKLS